jgi:hypothetical protein
VSSIEDPGSEHGFHHITSRSLNLHLLNINVSMARNLKDVDYAHQLLYCLYERCTRLRTSSLKFPSTCESREIVATTFCHAISRDKILVILNTEYCLPVCVLLVSELGRQCSLDYIPGYSRLEGVVVDVLESVSNLFFTVKVATPKEAKIHLNKERDLEK